MSYVDFREKMRNSIGIIYVVSVKQVNRYDIELMNFKYFLQNVFSFKYSNCIDKVTYQREVVRRQNVRAVQQKQFCEP